MTITGTLKEILDLAELVRNSTCQHEEQAGPIEQPPVAAPVWAPVLTTGQKIMQCRLEHGYSQRHLAMLSNVSQSEISAIERGTNNSAKKIALVLKALNVTSDCAKRKAPAGDANTDRSKEKTITKSIAED